MVNIMISSAEIRNVSFSNSMAGYKKDEVDILLDKIEVDLEKYESLLEQKDSKIAKLEAQIDELKESQSSIQSVLLSAQKLADKIVEDAKTESRKIVNEAQNNIAEMTEKGKIIASEFDNKANEKKERLEAELTAIIKDAEEKKTLIEKATEQSVKNQQEIFEKLKVEMAAFRNEVTEKYKEHLKLLATIPVSAEVDPKEAAKEANDNFKSIKMQEQKEEVVEAEEEVKETEEKEPEITEAEKNTENEPQESETKEEPNEKTDGASFTRPFSINESDFEDSSSEKKDN